MTPDPKKQPELYDDYDCQQREPLSQEYLDATLPEHVQKVLAARRAKAEKPAKSE